MSNGSSRHPPCGLLLAILTGAKGLWPHRRRLYYASDQHSTARPTLVRAAHLVVQRYPYRDTVHQPLIAGWTRDAVAVGGSLLGLPAAALPFSRYFDSDESLNGGGLSCLATADLTPTRDSLQKVSTPGGTAPRAGGGPRRFLSAAQPARAPGLNGAAGHPGG